MFFSFSFYFSGNLQQPGEPFTRSHLVHLVWSGLQHRSLPFIWPHLVQIAAVFASLGMLQQPGAPLTRPHSVHLAWSGLQQSSSPFIWPHIVQSATLSAAFTSDFLQPSPHRDSPTKASDIAIISHFLFAFINSSFQISYSLYCSKHQNTF
jgi:hypothetical protein